MFFIKYFFKNFIIRTWNSENRIDVNSSFSGQKHEIERMTKFPIFDFMLGASSFKEPCPASCINMIMMSLMLCTQILFSLRFACIHDIPSLGETSFECVCTCPPYFITIISHFFDYTTILSSTIHLYSKFGS